jgi:predicted O-linked N-acetylglucosamine transferase (SPINDLY family)
LRRHELGIPADAVIYFSAQTAAKRHPDTTRLQLQILKQVPNSYFLLKGLGDAKGMQTFFRNMAEEEGVESDRLFFLDRDNDEPTHRANLGIADVVLDTFPYNGATTTLETLWLGIPLVTQVGQQFASRNSYTMLRNVGIHTEGIAHSPEEYVEWGVRYGKDTSLRQTIRTRLQRSRQTAPLWNTQQFTRNLEAAFTQMWEGRRSSGG